MPEGLFALLGYDEADPKVAAAREDASELSDLIETLTRARHDRGLTQKAVAHEMETTQSAVSNFERIGGDPKISTILRYARAIGAAVQFVVTFNRQGQDAPTHVPVRAAQAGQSSFDGPLYLDANRQIRVAAQ